MHKTLKTSCVKRFQRIDQISWLCMKLFQVLLIDQYAQTSKLFTTSFRSMMQDRSYVVDVYEVIRGVAFMCRDFPAPSSLFTPPSALFNWETKKLRGPCLVEITKKMSIFFMNFCMKGMHSFFVEILRSFLQKSQFFSRIRHETLIVPLVVIHTELVEEPLQISHHFFGICSLSKYAHNLFHFFHEPSRRNLNLCFFCVDFGPSDVFVPLLHPKLQVEFANIHVPSILFFGLLISSCHSCVCT